MSSHETTDRRFWLRGTLLAALVVGGLLLSQWRRGDDDGPGTRSLVWPVRLLAPIGASLDDDTPFRWEATPPEARLEYVLTIWEAAAFTADPRAAPLIERHLATTMWARGAADPPLPDRIAWRVDVQPSEGVLRRGPVEQAWRQR